MLSRTILAVFSIINNSKLGIKRFRLFYRETASTDRSLMRVIFSLHALALATIMYELMIDESGYMLTMKADGLYFDVCQR